MLSPPSIQWTTEELEALQTTRLFQIKGKIIKKVWGHFESLREALREEINHRPLIAPEGIDTQTGQIAKGENHLFLPFVYLDFPKYFSRTEKCTFRTFFWWGNHVVFALILEGPLLPEYKKRIKANDDDLTKKKFHLTLAKDPWEWRKGPPYTLPLSDQNTKKFRSALEEKPFLKLSRFLDLKESAFLKGNLIKEGIETFRGLQPILFK